MPKPVQNSNFMLLKCICIYNLFNYLFVIYVFNRFNMSSKIIRNCKNGLGKL